MYLKNLLIQCGDRMNNIYIDTVGKMHSLYFNLIDYPPVGYEFISNQSIPNNLNQKCCDNNYIYNFQKKYMNKMMPVNLIKSYFEKIKKIPISTNLTYSSGHLIFRDEPWVVDLEFVTHLSGYNYNHFKMYQKIIEKNLASKNCKKIMPWTEAGKKTIFETIENDIILDKVETINLAVPKKDFIKVHNDQIIKILFVGSANIPRDFEIKGGKEVLETFSQLSKLYDNLELVIRSYVPPHINEKYKNIHNIRIIDEIIPWKELEQEFKSADIFLFPSHNTPGLAILDAMSYELPVITTDVWANHEMVTNGKTGFLVKKSKNIDYCLDNSIPNWTSSDNLKIIQNTIDSNVVNDLVKKTSHLIDNKNLRRKMGKNGRYEIENGKFSISKRNNKLNRIFCEALS